MTEFKLPRSLVRCSGRVGKRKRSNQLMKLKRIMSQCWLKLKKYQKSMRKVIQEFSLMSKKAMTVLRLKALREDLEAASIRILSTSSLSETLTEG